MANSASLLRYARLPGLGWRRGTLVQGKNGRIKPNAVFYNGVEYTVGPDNGHFQIRQYENGKSIYTNCGTDVETALARLSQIQAKATLLTAQRKLGVANERTQQLLTSLLGPFIEKYAHGSDDTVYAYRYIVNWSVADKQTIESPHGFERKYIASFPSALRDMYLTRIPEFSAERIVFPVSPLATIKICPPSLYPRVGERMSAWSNTTREWSHEIRTLRTGRTLSV
jgi:hypothetical protein